MTDRLKTVYPSKLRLRGGGEGGGTYGQVLMLYDIWLSIYRLLKNITAEILYYGQVLDFDLWPQPLAWTLGSDVMD